MSFLNLLCCYPSGTCYTWQMSSVCRVIDAPQSCAENHQNSHHCWPRSMQSFVKCRETILILKSEWGLSKKSKIFNRCLSAIPAGTTHTPWYFRAGTESHSTDDSWWHDSAVMGLETWSVICHCSPQSSNIRVERTPRKGGREEEGGERINWNR